MSSTIAAGQLRDSFNLSQLIPDWDLPYKYVFGFALLTVICWQIVPLRFSSRTSKSSTFPILDQGKWWDIFNLKPKMLFYYDGRKALEDASSQAHGKPFRMLGPGVLTTILPAEYVDEIRNDKRLSFTKVVEKVSSCNVYPVVLIQTCA